MTKKTDWQKPAYTLTIDGQRMTVDFGSPWDPNEYPIPALEIQRRMALVHEAFESVRESYERSFTVTL